MSELRNLFFIHVPKTAGTTLSQQLEGRYPLDQTYPSSENNLHQGWWNYNEFLHWAKHRDDRPSLFLGHYPAALADALPEDFIQVSVLRHPVARTLSFLKMRIIAEPFDNDSTLMDVYETQKIFMKFIYELQTRMFSVTPDDPGECFWDAVEMDRKRLAIAKARLEKVHVLGVQEQFADFCDRFEKVVGWSLDQDIQARVSGGSWDVPQELVDRIEKDNPLDMELYAHALELLSRR